MYINSNQLVSGSVLCALRSDESFRRNRTFPRLNDWRFRQILTVMPIRRTTVILPCDLRRTACARLENVAGQVLWQPHPFGVITSHGLSRRRWPTELFLYSGTTVLEPYKSDINMSYRQLHNTIKIDGPGVVRSGSS